MPEAYSFWDLHVAIQDAMGWLDCHLHTFRVLDTDEKRISSIGIPTDEDPEGQACAPGWRVQVSRYFGSRPYHAIPSLYAYDGCVRSRDGRVRGSNSTNESMAPAQSLQIALQRVRGTGATVTFTSYIAEGQAALRRGRFHGPKLVEHPAEFFPVDFDPSSAHQVRTFGFNSSAPRICRIIAASAP